MKVRWGFLDLEAEVFVLGEKVAYSWKCAKAEHEHTIGCLWVWHDCTMELDLVRLDAATRPDDISGWVPAGVGKHDLISIKPLHIEASVYWPLCCGMHGWIRDGKWENA